MEEEKKELQKVTEFENIKTVDDGKKFIEENPEVLLELRNKAVEKLNESFKDGNGKEYRWTELAVRCMELLGDNDYVTKLRNVTYESNYATIVRVIHNYILENRGFPTANMIAEISGLSRQTVYRHLRNDFKGRYDTLIKGRHQIMANKALEHLYYLGVQEDNAGALKSFIEFTGNGNKGNTTNNYIQINNLQLTKEEFEQLPDEVILGIENLISQFKQSLKPSNN